MPNVRLVPTLDEHLSIVRQRRGRGFRYLAAGRRKIAAKATLKRIRALAIPPMWEEVLIASGPHCHIQAVGRDQKGRKQYIYHEQWQLRQQRRKFARLLAFAERLPELRKHCLALIRKRAWSKEKALALMVFILDDTGIRIGNRRYLQDNRTHGLSTLQDRHVKVDGRTTCLHFTGKGSKEVQVEIDDPRLSLLIRQSVELPGCSLFRYQDSSGTWQDVDSDDLNNFVQDIMGAEFTCKDFRTWAGTRLVLELFPAVLAQSREKPRSKVVNLLVAAIAKKLGNTPSVCRAYYIHPTLLTLAGQHKLPALPSAVRAARSSALRPDLSRLERATLALLRTTNTG